MNRFIVIPAVLFLLVSCVFAARALAAKSDSEASRAMTEPWSGPYGGLPPFDKVKVSEFAAAFDKAMAQEREEIQKITSNKNPATFENTILGLERAGKMMDRVSSLYNVWSTSRKDADFQKVEQEMSPKLAAFQDEIFQNENLFRKIEAVYNSPEKSKLTSEQQRLVWLQYNRFVLQGAKLNSQQKAQVAKINQRLALLSTQFSQNELADEENNMLLLEKSSDLVGLPQSIIDGYAAEAEHRGKKGMWVVANTRSSMEPFLTFSANRNLREQAFRTWSTRGDGGDAHDNNAIIAEILSLRSERSKIMGFPNYASWRLADTMAKQPQAAMDLMMQVWKPAVERAHQEVADMQAIVDAEHGKFKIQPWDYRFYAEKVRKAKYDLDLNTVKPYLQLENIRKAMFWMAGELYGFKFVKLDHIKVFNDQMSVYKVLGRDGKLVGVWYFDPYARAGKNSGAWMTAYREQSKLDGKDIKTIVSNNANFIPGKLGEPVLISWDDAITMFHEFGHALHGLNSKVTYQTLSGTNTTRDFVEFPSQFHENYMSTPEVLKFLVDKEGHPIPADLIAKIQKAKTFNQGFATVEFLASAIVDMKLHLAPTPVDTREFEKVTLKELGMPKEIIMRHRIPHFGHLFSSEDYAAGYYGYLWAQVLDHDAYEAFTEAQGPFDKKVAQSFQDHIMSVGNTIDPKETYRLFRGRDAKVDALLRERGFPVPVTQIQ